MFYYTGKMPILGTDRVEYRIVGRRDLFKLTLYHTMWTFNNPRQEDF